jgi:outer membrane protein TolC
MIKPISMFLLLSLSASLENIDALTLSEYIDQVSTRQKSIQGSQKSAQAALKRAEEANLVVLPTLVGDGSYFQDDFVKATFPVATESQYSSKIGVKEQTPVGLDIEVSSIFQKQNLVGYTGTPYSYSQNQVLLVASLWRNILGAEVRAHKNMVESAAMASHFSELYQAKLALANAEAAYWNLVLARSSVEFQKNSLKRSERLYEWNRKKSMVDLVNESSLSQASANLALRRTVLESSKSLEREMRYIFNTMRATSGEEVEELSAALDVNEILTLKVPEVLKVRDDYLAQTYSLDAKAAEAQSAREKNSPDLRFYTTFMSSGQANSGESKRAIANSFQFQDNGYSLGISLTVPLSVFNLAAARSGWAEEVEAAQLKKEAVVFQNRQEFYHLKHSFEEGVNLLKLRLDVESAQKKRLESDQKLFDRGRTTTFQLIQAEEDFSSAQLARLDVQAKALTLYAKLKLYL